MLNLLYNFKDNMSRLQHFKLNQQGRDFFVGDIHGCFSLLQSKLDEISFNPRVDRVFSVGDLIDRGEESDKVIEWLNKPWFHAVRGNHEDMCINYFRSSPESRNSSYLINGGGWFIELPRNRQEKIVNYLSDLPYQITVETARGTVGVIHAEVTDNDWDFTARNLSDSYAIQRKALWAREKIRGGVWHDAHIRGIDYVVVGHTPLTQPRLLGNVFYIDTGACYGDNGGGITLKTIHDLIKEVV